MSQLGPQSCSPGPILCLEGGAHRKRVPRDSESLQPPGTTPGAHREGSSESGPGGKLLFAHEILMAPCQRQKQTSNVLTGVPEARKLGLVLWADQSEMRPHPPGRVFRERREDTGGQGKAWIHAVCETRGPGSVAGWTALSEGISDQ